MTPQTLLHTDREAFREIVALASEKFGFEQSHVEKDYWISKILRDITLSEYKNKTFFKGGTSLSKAYGLIDRFSEDLDLFVFTGDVGSSKQAEKTLNKRLSEFVIESNVDMYRDDMSKRGGNFNTLSFVYDNIFNYVGLKGNVEVEVKSCDLSDKHQMFYPIDTRRVQPIVGTYLESEGRKDLIEAFSLEQFQVLCISPKRTLCDKISRLVRLSFATDFIDQLAKYIRDIYDITVIYEKDEYAEFVHSEDFLDCMHKVTLEDEQYKNYPQNTTLAEAPIFKNAQEIMSLPKIMTAYNVDLKMLIFNNSDLPHIEEVVKTLGLLHERLKGVE